MSTLSIPYFDTELNTRLSLKPHQMNNDLYIHLKNNLKLKLEKKCVKYGFVVKIYKITDYSDGEILPENYDSSAIFNITYSCRLCLPTQDTSIVCELEVLNKALLKAKNGPITCIIKTNQINLNNFNINNKGDIVYTKNNSVLKIGNHVIVKIIGVQFVVGDERIIIISSLEDLATKEIVNKFYIQDHNTEKIDEINDIESLDTIETSDEEEI